MRTSPSLPVQQKHRRRGSLTVRGTLCLVVLPLLLLAACGSAGSSGSQSGHDPDRTRDAIRDGGDWGVARSSDQLDAATSCRRRFATGAERAIRPSALVHAIDAYYSKAANVSDAIDTACLQAITDASRKVKLQVDPAPASTLASAVDLSGRVKPVTAHVSIADSPVRVDRQGHFERRVSLVVGDNYESVEASAPDYQSVTRELTVHRKRVPAHLGSTLVLDGQEDGERIAVTVERVEDPLPVGEFDTPSSGRRNVGVFVLVKNVGSANYDDSLSNGATLVTAEDHQADTTIVSDGPCGGDFASDLKLVPGERREGCIPLEVPESEAVKTFEYTPDSGFSDSTGRWDVTH